MLDRTLFEGAKGVGKTATATRRAHTVISLNQARDRELVGSDPDYIVERASPVFIDEWQLMPDVWDRVRTSVDEDTTGGRFLLAGSAGVAPGVRIHSGAGRIVRLHMRPMSFEERRIDEPTVSLSALLAGNADVAGRTDVDVEVYVDEIIRSGMPGLRDLPDAARRAQLDSYLDRILDRELPENGVVVRPRYARG